jgi:hypothetical protein
MNNGNCRAAKRMEDEHWVAWADRLIDSQPEFI